MDLEYLRPEQAASRFGCSRQVLGKWADAGLIRRSRVGRTVWYVASDIAELRAGNLSRRTVVPISATPTLTTDDSWRDDDLWAGTSAGRGSAR